MTKTILGIFDNENNAESAINELKDDGFNPKDISIVMRDSDRVDVEGSDAGSNVAEGAVGGATTGAVVGGIAGFLAGTVLPGLAGFLIGGPIGAALGLTGAAATTVSGAATGAVAGGLIGGLMGLGLSSEEAEHYQERVEEGAILLAVPIRDKEETRVKDIFDANHASDVKTVDNGNERSQMQSHQRAHFN